MNIIHQEEPVVWAGKYNLSFLNLDKLKIVPHQGNVRLLSTCEVYRMAAPTTSRLVGR